MEGEPLMPYSTPALPSRRSEGSTAKQRHTRKQVLNSYMAELREYRTLKEELSPWTKAFNDQHKRKPRLSDVEDTGTCLVS